MQVQGKVRRVLLRGTTAYDGEQVLAQPGAGRVLRPDPGHFAPAD
jgi:hypothetical protein